MSTTLQRALANVTPEEAQAIFQALGQFTENNVEPLELVQEQLEAETGDLSAAQVSEFAVTQEAGLAVLDRMNANLAGLAG